MMEKMDSHNGQLQQANFSDANTVSPPPAKCCRASPAADDNGAHVCQQFTVVAPWLGLRPHSRGGCIIVTGFRGCAVKQFHAVNRKCNRLRVSILFSRQFTRRQPKGIFRSKFLPQRVFSLSLFPLASASHWFIWANLDFWARLSWQISGCRFGHLGLFPFGGRLESLHWAYWVIWSQTGVRNSCLIMRLNRNEKMAPSYLMKVKFPRFRTPSRNVSAFLSW